MDAKHAKVWTFLLPDTGTHEFRVEHLGQKGRTVFLDGVELAAPPGTLTFTGPGGSLLELKHNQHVALEGGLADFKVPEWQLSVNGLVVEQHKFVHAEAVHDVKLKDGSYTIAPKFSAAGVGLHVGQKFCFLVRGMVCEVGLAHKDHVFHMVYDGDVVARVAHERWEQRCSAAFPVKIADGLEIEVEFLSTYSDGSWQSAIAVNHINVPASSLSDGEVLAAGLIPEVAGASGQKPPSMQTEDAAPPAVLPQGVSYDGESGMYQASLRVGGRFMQLGNFAKPEDAHVRYLEELAKQKPEQGAS